MQHRSPLGRAFPVARHRGSADQSTICDTVRQDEKNDRNDAEAIVEAASRPAMRFVTVKSVEQQDIQAAHHMRAILLRHRTAMINQMRGLLGERGPTISRSPEAFKREIPELLSKSADELTSLCQTLLTELLQHLHAIEARIHLIEVSIQSFMKKSTLCKKIAEVPGIGPITATAVIAAVGDAKQFRWPASGSLARLGATSILVGRQASPARHQSTRRHILVDLAHPWGAGCSALCTDKN
jgi:transposase